MKKGLLLVAVIFSALFLTGCGGNKLVCTMSVTQQTMGYDINIDQKISVGFSDDKISDADVVVDVKLSNELYDVLKQQGDIDTNMKALASQLESEFKTQFGEASKTSSANYSGQTVTVKIDLDASKSQAGSTREEVKKTFENGGFSCN